jgi:hypothetical protein
MFWGDKIKPYEMDVKTRGGENPGFPLGKDPKFWEGIN